MISQTIEDLSIEDYAEEADGTGFTVEIAGVSPGEQVTAADQPGTGGGIWAVVTFHDPQAGIRFLVDTFGFTEQLVVTSDDDPSVVVHSELRWPEGGVVQVASAADDPIVGGLQPGDQSLYVITQDPQAVWARCEAAGLEVVRPPESPDYDPEGLGFTVRDPEGNVWSFGSYGA